MSVSAKSLWMRTRLHWDQLAVYVPLLLMGLLALATYWLVRNTPVVKDAALLSAPQHLPDYFMRDFSVKVFDAHGKLKNEMAGVQGRTIPTPTPWKLTNHVFVPLRQMAASRRRVQGEP